ncbi:hypothetical protein I7I51_02461 [Histoplasma capsulatum]|uniref:DUF7924 domain-containing protein n=1 Tax=Ajellomyces capsulatus TaxID=5037 RepID=A0A8A1ME02_AJECA|nr:hypothetical protein I7I51_02461 [Histoplasma capsulatum]
MPPQLASNSIFERLCTVLDTATYSMKVSMKAGIALSFYGPRPQPDYSVGFGRSAFTDDQLEKLKPFVGEVTDTFTSYFMAIRGRTRHQNMFIGLHKNLLDFRQGGMAISHVNPHCVLTKLSQNNQARFPQIQYFTGGPCDSCLGLYLHIADWACQGGGSGRRKFVF